MTEPTPDLLAGKYKTQDDLIKAYKEAESELGKLRTKLAERESPHLPDNLKARPAGDEPNPDAKSAEARAMAKVQVALNALIGANPQAESLLGELGVPTETARAALGIAANAQKKYVENIYNAAGGEAAYKETLRWAGESGDLTDYERESIFAEIESGNPSRVLVQVRALRQRYEQEVGHAPTDLVQAVPGGDAKRIAPFGSEAEMARHFADKRYGVDSVYTAECEARARISDVNKPSRG